MWNANRLIGFFCILMPPDGGVDRNADLKIGDPQRPQLCRQITELQIG